MNKHKTLTVKAKAPDSRGTFTGSIDFNPPDGDKDGERIASWQNLPTRVPLGYAHTYSDPGAHIGTAHAMTEDERRMTVLGRLDLDNAIARAVHERMLLPSDDPLVLAELSVGFDVDLSKNTKDENGVVVLHDCVLTEISVVHRGAQTTAVQNVKNTTGSAGSFTVRWRDPLILSLEEQLDAMPGPDPVDVDAFVAETRALDAAAKAERVEQAEWEETARNRAMGLQGYSLEDEQRDDAEAHERYMREVRERQQREAAERAAVKVSADDVFTFDPMGVATFEPEDDTFHIPFAVHDEDGES